MDFLEVSDKQVWNDFINQNGPRSGSFLHMWEWGTFQESVGYSVIRRAITHEGKVEMAAQMIKKTLPFGMNYLYCPRGPVVSATSHAGELTSMIVHSAAQTDALFFRFEPTSEGVETARDPAIVKSIDLHPRYTILMDLTQHSEALLAGMHTKTRYNIRLAQKKSVEIEIGTDVSLDDVWTVFEKTAARGGFHLHAKSYYEKMLSALSGSACRAFLAVAKIDGKIIAANIMIDCGDTRTYLHGASDHEYRKLMAPHLLHWKLIQDAQEKGLRSYDWWGVAPEGAENHPWSGITRFKEGFGGERVVYPGTFDIILRPFPYKLYSRARSVIRKFR